MPLFPVVSKVDFNHFDPKRGITLSIDKILKAMRVDSGMNTSGIAWARFSDKLSTTGWMELVVETTDSARVSNDVKMYAAGFVEGILTAVRTSQFFANTYQSMMIDPDAERAYQNVKNMFWDELEYVKNKTNFVKGPSSPPPRDPYWKHVRYVYEQVWGVKDGYNQMAQLRGANMLDMLDMLAINSHGELPELMEIYSPQNVKIRRSFQEKAGRTDLTFLQRSGRLRSRGPQGVRNTSRSGVLLSAKQNTSRDWLANLSDRDWEHRLAKHGHCSSLVRLGPDNRTCSLAIQRGATTAR
jgi:hypothetical protein